MLKRVTLIAASLLLLIAIAAIVWFRAGAQPKETEQLNKLASGYLRALYAQDYERAYGYISARDHRTKNKTEYMRENPSFPDVARSLATELARSIDIGKITANIAGNQATIEFPVRVPNANSPELQELFKGFDPDRLAELSPEERQKILETVRNMNEEGRLPMIAGTETLDLIKEDGAWRVFVNWTDAVKVVFKAEVKEGLPWAFEPVQSMVMAKPGETLHAAYRAKNLADVPWTAKARHSNKPKELAQKYLDIVQCFCFIQQTLAPGEEKELPVIFRVDLDVPPEVKEFVVTYQFFPVDKFPKDEG